MSRIRLEVGKTCTYYGKTRKEVTDKLKAAQKQVEEGLSLDTDRITVAQFLERWLTDTVKPSVKIRTCENYESVVRVRIVPRIGTVKLGKLRPLDVQKLYTDLKEDKDSPLSPRSILHTHRVLHRALGQAVKWNMIARNPCDGATAPKAQRTEMQVLTPDHVRQFLTATATHDAHALYVLAITNGMRAGELLGSKWSDIDLDTGRLTVQPALQQQNSGRGWCWCHRKQPGPGV